MLLLVGRIEAQCVSFQEHQAFTVSHNSSAVFTIIKRSDTTGSIEFMSEVIILSFVVLHSFVAFFLSADSLFGFASSGTLFSPVMYYNISRPLRALDATLVHDK